MSAAYPDGNPRDLYRHEFLEKLKRDGFAFDGVMIRGGALDKPVRLADFEARWRYRAILEMLKGEKVLT